MVAVVLVFLLKGVCWETPAFCALRCCVFQHSLRLLEGLFIVLGTLKKTEEE